MENRPTFSGRPTKQTTYLIIPYIDLQSIGRMAGFEPTANRNETRDLHSHFGNLITDFSVALPLSYIRHFAYSLRYQRFNSHADTLKISQYLASFTIAFKGATHTYPLHAALQRWCFYGFYQALL